ncbi:hypothetical protein G210_1297 [Candida maltosa Xu316]|uniref:Uncharacterized protein n=1 Tax=Candida maltosa (strain Xu316) TaxID=1245528 RepID=M3JYW5_CANMX|nr:hypothetical protein G210_1297 [Candida maltosa Xu316]
MTPSGNHPLFEDLETLFTSTVDFGELSRQNSSLTSLLNLGSHYKEFVKQSPDDDTESSKSNSTTRQVLPFPNSTIDDIKPSDSLFSMSHQEENILLKHFFKKLLPLLDGHPSSPWPDLALKYCDFNIARSCFISLACMHMYECKEGGTEYYVKGVAHINNTMDHLIQYINETTTKIKLDGSSSYHMNSDEMAKTHSSSFVILVLMNVYILFSVLEKGKSAMARYFFEVFGTICQDSTFYENVLLTNDKKRSLLVVLSWYDTVAAIVSPDCRLPCSMPEWYGTITDSISTAKMMGCPGEVFIAMSEVCMLRHEKHNGISSVSTPSQHQKRYEDIKYRLINYREYVPFATDQGEEPYVSRLKCAACWMSAVLITLNRVVQPENYSEMNQKIVHEFINTYGTMDSKSPLVTQMVWPVYAIACECKTEDERTALLIYMETLYETAQMGTLYSLKEIVLKVWERNITQEEYLKEWLEDGIDYLPV